MVIAPSTSYRSFIHHFISLPIFNSIFFTGLVWDNPSHWLLIEVMSIGSDIPSGYLLHSHGRKWPIEIDEFPSYKPPFIRDFHGYVSHNQRLTAKNRWVAVVHRGPPQGPGLKIRVLVTPEGRRKDGGVVGPWWSHCRWWFGTWLDYMGNRWI